MMPAPARSASNYFEVTADWLQDSEWVYEARQVLRATGYPQFRSIEVMITDGIATIRGTVPTYYLKQMAQSVLMDLEGVRAVQNELAVI